MWKQVNKTAKWFLRMTTASWATQLRKHFKSSIQNGKSKTWVSNSRKIFRGKYFSSYTCIFVLNLHLILPKCHFVETRYSHSAVFNINLNYLFSSPPLIFKTKRLEQSTLYKSRLWGEGSGKSENAYGLILRIKSRFRHQRNFTVLTSLE